MNRRKPLWIDCLLFFLLIVILPGFLIWREWRQERLTAQLLATVKEEPSLSAIDYYRAQDTTRPDREYFKPQILREESTVVRLLQEGADPTVRADDGSTAIQAAKQNADPPADADGIIALLKDYGAKR
jgi:hypothetical protein